MLAGWGPRPAPPAAASPGAGAAVPPCTAPGVAGRPLGGGTLGVRGGGTGESGGGGETPDPPPLVTGKGGEECGGGPEGGGDGPHRRRAWGGRRRQSTGGEGGCPRWASRRRGHLQGPPQPPPPLHRDGDHGRSRRRLRHCRRGGRHWTFPDRYKRGLGACKRPGGGVGGGGEGWVSWGGYPIWCGGGGAPPRGRWNGMGRGALCWVGPRQALLRQLPRRRRPQRPVVGWRVYARRVPVGSPPRAVSPPLVGGGPGVCVGTGSMSSFRQPCSCTLEA